MDDRIRIPYKYRKMITGGSDLDKMLAEAGLKAKLASRIIVQKIRRRFGVEDDEWLELRREFEEMMEELREVERDRFWRGLERRKLGGGRRKKRRR